MKSDLFEALETLRAWYLADQNQMQMASNKKMEQEEQKIIAEALEVEMDLWAEVAKELKEGSLYRGVLAMSFVGFFSYSLMFRKTVTAFQVNYTC